jgi:hypothetical protein
MDFSQDFGDTEPAGPEQLSFPDSTLEELRTPTAPEDLPALALQFRTVESLEKRYAEDRFAHGKVAMYCVAKGRRPMVCLNMAQFERAQRMARANGWR